VKLPTEKNMKLDMFCFSEGGWSNVCFRPGFGRKVWRGDDI